MSNARRDLERRARRAILEHAVLRWESALVIALTIILSFVLADFWWLALILGLVAEGALVGFSLASPKQNARAIEALFKQQFNPRRLKDKTLQQRVDKALGYWGQIETTVRNSKEGVLRDRMGRTTSEVGDWVAAIYRLAQGLDNYQGDEIIKRDLRTVRPAIDDLRQRLNREDNSVVRGQLEQTIADKERQWQYLDRLQNTMDKAGYQIESTLSALGTVYSQLLLVGTRDEQGSRADRLQEEIHEQVSQLQDLTEAMDEVYRE
jgi:hypothetical protein